MEGDVAVYFRVLLVGFLAHLVAGSCSDTSLGMEAEKIPDNKISASSEDSVNTPAKNGRLKYTTGQSWCATTQNSDQYLQIDFEIIYIICAVATQGNSKADQWVETYQLETSIDGTTWTNYKEGGGAKVFTANSDRNTVVKHVLLKGIVAKLIRFLPKSHSGSVCLRVEVFGIKHQQENIALNKTASQSSTPSAKYLMAALVVDGIPGGQCSTTATSTNPWWQVDLGEIAVVSEVNIVSQASSEEFKVKVGGTLCQGTLKIPDGGPLSIVCSNKPIHQLINISVTGNNKVLTLCEVKVFLNVKAESVNLALKKDAKQSSTRKSDAASKAVDGNRNNKFNQGSCSHTGTDEAAGDKNNPWWRVDLGKIQPVSRVYVVNRDDEHFVSLSNFELRIGNNDSEGVVSNPKCGDKYSVPKAKALNIYCNPPMYGRYVYIRIPGKKKDVVMCEVEVYSDGKACANQAVGTSNSALLPDNRWTASSNKSGNEPYKARLDGAGAWIPSTNSGADYLQIDLGAAYVICAVATQGNPNKDEWTKTYKIKISVNKDDWTDYKEENVVKVLTGNADRNSIVKYNLVGLNKARFVRFVPDDYNGGKALRVEIYGLLQGNCSDTSLGMESGKIPDNKISASTEGSSTPAENGRMYTAGQSWCASRQNSDQYLQIDLGTNYIICAVATQGNSKADQWVKTYQLETSTNGTTWTNYEEGGQVKVFAANSDRDTIVKHVLLKGIVAKLIRFLPKSHSGSVCLRAEVFGTKHEQESVALQKPTNQSSTATGKYGAALAVNGIHDGHCSTATRITNPWWQVDLGKSVAVSEVYIVSRASSEEFMVLVGGTPQGTLKIPDGGPLSIVCSNEPRNQLIRISVTGNNKVLTLCEVKVMEAEPVNLALNKPAKQSTTRSASNGCNKASCAVDGNRSKDFVNGKSCSHTEGGKDNPWWRVDLGTIQPVSRVYVVNRNNKNYDYLSNFELRIGNNDSEGVVSNPKCGDQYSVPCGKALTIYCNPPMYGRYVYIRIPASGTLVMCEVEVYSDRNACANQAIDTSNSTLLPNNRWNASSDKTGNEPYRARLDGAGAWSPATNTGTDYLQIDLGAVYIICAVATQGNPNADKWTQTYKIKMSLNIADWTDYKENNSEKVLTGNADRNSKVKYNFVGLHQARFVRFVPVDYKGGKAMRVEIYGSLHFWLPSPSNLLVNNIQARSAMVNWTNPDDYLAVGIAFVNKIRYSSGNNTKDITTQSLTTSHSVTGLTPYTEYKVRVAVLNVEQGPWSAEENFTTDSDVPEEAPILTTVKALTSQSIQVTWQKPGKINGELLGYKVLYRKKGQSSFKTKTLNGSATSHTLNSLEKWTEYEVKVQVYNSKGDSPESDVNITRTLEDVPGIAPNLKSVVAFTSQSINITWEKPSEINGPLVGYKVLYRKKGQSSFTNKPLNGEATSHTLSSLEKWTEYEVKVQVYNSKGDSPASDMKIVITLEDVPEEAPTLSAVTALTSQSIKVTWQKPDKINGELVGYKVLHKKKGESSFITETLTGSATSHTLSSLEKWTEYEVKVQVYNSKFTGPASDVNITRTLEDVPGIAPNLKSVVAFTSQSINITWEKPSEINGPLVGYKVLYRKKGQSSFTNETLTGEATSHTLSSLEKWTEYEVKVQVYNSKFTGPASDMKIVITLEDVPEEAPTLLAVTALTSQSIKVTWQKPGKINGELVGYKVLYRKKGQNSFTNDTLTEADKSHTLSSLEKWTEYEVKVQVYNSKGDSPASDVKTVRTLEDVPEKAPILNSMAAFTSQSINVTWSKPDKINGVLVGYRVLYKKKGKSIFITKTLTGEGTSHTLNSLEEWTEYEVKVKVYNSKGDSPASDVNSTRTLEDIPTAPPKFSTVTQLNETTFNVSWTLSANEANGIVTYTVQLTLLSGARKRRHISSVDQSTSFNTSLNYTVLELPLCAKFNFSVRAFTVIGNGPFSPAKKLEAQVSKSSLALSNLKAAPRGKGYRLTWDAPERKVEGGLSYIVSYVGTKYYNETFKSSRTIKIKDKYRMFEELVPGTKYKFSVHAVSSCGDGKNSSAEGNTKVMDPEPPEEIKMQKVSGGERITIPPFEQKNGPISLYQVIVNSDDTLPGNYSSELHDYNKAIEKALKFYITAELDYNNSAIEFLVGDDKEYRSYKNVKLAPGSHYIYVRAVTNGELYSDATMFAKVTVAEEASTDESSVPKKFPTEIVVPLVVIVLLIILAVAGFFVWRRRRVNKGNDRREGDVQMDELDTRGSRDQLMSKNTGAGAVSNAVYAEGNAAPEDVYSEVNDDPPRPIPALSFADYASRMKKNDSAHLRAEFKLVQASQQFPCSVGKRPENKLRNRYANIITYDHTRVLLENLETDDDNDYINASYMPGYSGDTKTYIATQGPSNNTFDDFWQMVWQENSTSIIMLTNLVESGKTKCSQYWPSDSKVYGSVTVSFQREEVFADYIIRTFVLKKGEVSRPVRQFHFISWPDKGVPQYPTAVLSFRRKVRAWKPAKSGPTVVHCSAGVGRTGTYIIIDAMMEQVKKQKTVDIFNYTQKLRKCRPHMVQTDEQYVFIHQAILEALTCGNTEISVQDLRIAMNKLSEVSKGGGANGYSKEFERLKAVSDDISVDESQAGRQPENFSKNRFSHVIPLDSARVILRAGEVQGYINASFTDAYRERNAFIMTQAPLESTIKDFWRMALQYNIKTVVMLNNPTEDDVNFPQYWPSEGALTYGDITVETASEEQKRGNVVRKLKIYEVKRPKHVLIVQHHQYPGWPDKTVPANHESVLDLLTAVQMSQQQSDNAPIIVHCSDGVGRSGTFCAIYSAVERLKEDQVVDIFQTIKVLRVKRPGAVESMDQYVFCYEAVQNYLDSFSEYANF